MRGRSLSAVVLASLAGLVALPAGAINLAWEFEGSVVYLSPDNGPSGPSLGARFVGVVRFTDEPLGETLYTGTGTTRSFAWRDVTVGIELTVDRDDFSAIGSGELFQLTKLDDQYSTIFPGHSGPVDAIRFVSVEEPFSTSFGDLSYRRNLVLDLVDFDALIFDETDLPLDPPSLSSLELETLDVGLNLPDQRVNFIGEIDRLAAVPEPNTLSLLSSGLLVFAVSRRNPASAYITLRHEWRRDP